MELYRFGLAVCFGAAALTLLPIVSNAATLSNGTGDGDVTLEVDPLGFMDWAIFDPVGSTDAGDVVYDSFVTTSGGEFDYGMANIASNVQVLTQSANSMRSSFDVNFLSFTLDQTLSDAVQGGAQTGSVFTQAFTIQNTSTVPVSFSMYRYMDGDLYLTDTTLADSGGVTAQGSTLVLYETDLVGGTTAVDTFLGITAFGGTNAGNDGYAVAQCCSLSLPMSNAVDFDNDGDGIADTSYDVTLQLQDDFLLMPGEVQAYTTTTIFGNGEPPAPGSSPSTPLLPTSSGGSVPGFTFSIPVLTLQVQQTFFIDPDIATGYTYQVVGADFYSVTAPEFAYVPDGDGTYTISYNGNTYTLFAGQTHTFLTPVTSFVLSGIDPSLLLDPNNPLAFVTGIALDNIDPLIANVDITQTPIITTIPDTQPVPLPASAVLFAGGLGSLIAVRRAAARAH